MSVATLIDSIYNNAPRSCDIRCNDITVDGSADIKGDISVNNLEVLGSTSLAGTLDVKGETTAVDVKLSGNVTIENTNPAVVIINTYDPPNTNRATLALAGRGGGVGILAGAQVQQDETGKMIIQNFAGGATGSVDILTVSNNDINLTPHGTGRSKVSNLSLVSSDMKVNSIVLLDDLKKTTTKQLSDGEVLIGRTGLTPVGGFISVGSNITRVDGAGSITLTGAINNVGTGTVFLNFGGGVTGMDYAENSLDYSLNGKIIYFRFNILLNLKGSSTGNATITFPFASAVAGSLQTIPITYMQDIGTGGTDPILISGKWGLGDGFMSLHMYNTNTGSLNPLTHSNFSNTSRIYCQGILWTD